MNEQGHYTKGGEEPDMRYAINQGTTSGGMKKAGARFPNDISIRQGPNQKMERHQRDLICKETRNDREAALQPGGGGDLTELNLSSKNKKNIQREKSKYLQMQIKLMREIMRDIELSDESFGKNLEDKIKEMATKFEGDITVKIYPVFLLHSENMFKNIDMVATIDFQIGDDSRQIKTFQTFKIYPPNTDFDSFIIHSNTAEVGANYSIQVGNSSESTYEQELKNIAQTVYQKALERYKSYFNRNSASSKSVEGKKRVVSFGTAPRHKSGKRQWNADPTITERNI
jgi:hypothetical protein